MCYGLRKGREGLVGARDKVFLSDTLWILACGFVTKEADITFLGGEVILFWRDADVWYSSKYRKTERDDICEIHWQLPILDRERHLAVVFLNFLDLTMKSSLWWMSCLTRRLKTCWHWQTVEWPECLGRPQPGMQKGKVFWAILKGNPHPSSEK